MERSDAVPTERWAATEIEAPRRWTPVCRRWPVQLRWIAQPPQELWICGSQPNDAPAIAIVGSRKATVSGLRVAFQISSELSRRGFRIVSGLALGIDAAALDGALLGGSETGGPAAAPLALLGNGLPAIYPAANRPLARRILSCGGALISEYPSGTAPRPYHFPRRNRLISGWSVAVVVIEATRRSGSMGTAQHALDQGCEVCAVPGPVDSASHEGCHQLIRDGAHLVTCARDIIEVCGGMGVGGSRFGLAGAAPVGLAVDVRRLDLERKQHGDDLRRLHEVTGWSPVRLLRAWSGTTIETGIGQPSVSRSHQGQK